MATAAPHLRMFERTLEPSPLRLVLVGIFLMVVPTALNESLAAPPLTIRLAALESGDLIFRRGSSALSRLVLETDRETTFSHVGLVWKSGTDTRVIHVSVSEDPHEPDVVRVDPIARFLAPDRATAYAVYRYESSSGHAAEEAIGAALRYLARRVPFDAAFDVETPERLYCAEFVWRAYLEAGIDLVGSEFKTISFLGTHRAYITLGQLLASPGLSLVDAFPLSQPRR